MNQEINNCPLCLEKLELHKPFGKHDILFKVGCFRCQLFVHSDNPDFAIFKWNSLSNDILSTVQKENKEWTAKNFPNKKPVHPVLGAAEEIGELCHAFLKHEQGIRVNENHIDNMQDAVADCIIYLCDFANQMNFDIAQVLKKTWSEVKKRDWTTKKQDGTK